MDFKRKKTDNISMSESLEFLSKLKNALKEKGDFLNSTELPKMLESYRLLHICVRNLYEILVKRSLITPDPYKLETKISDISVPDESPFLENERSLVIGSRLSDYESMLDFICTYIKFSTDGITIPRIKKLLELNNSFQWNNMTPNCPNANTRGLAVLIQEARKGTQQLQSSLISDSVAKSAKTIEEINLILKELMAFQRESYKIKIRHDIFEHPKYDKAKASSSVPDEIAEIKKVFPSVMGKTPYYSELIQEIASEDLSPNRTKLQEATLLKLQIKQKEKKETKNTVDYKRLLLNCLQTLSNLGELYEFIEEKLTANINIFEKQKNTFFKKIKKALRSLFNLSEPPLIYNVTITDPKKGTQTHRSIDINVFITNIQHKSNLFNALSNRGSVEFNKAKNLSEEKLLEYLNKSISENQEILVLLDACDEFFKQQVTPRDRSKIKGLKIDLISVKNIIIKAVQQRSEYVAYIEEQEQMARLGIKNEY